jgi:four helix bundle protein
VKHQETGTKYEVRITKLEPMQDLKIRFKKFAIAVATIIQKLPKNTINIAYCNQLIRSSSSPGTNYRAALRGKSTADFINKLKIVEEELDESLYFMELLCHFNNHHQVEIEQLMKEGNELIAITVTSIKPARLKLRTA